MEELAELSSGGMISILRIEETDETADGLKVMDKLILLDINGQLFRMPGDKLIELIKRVMAP